MLNLSNVYIKTNTVLKNLLNKYELLNLISFDESDENDPVYLVQNIRNGFYYKEQPSRTGETEEIINIVPENDTVAEAIEEATMIELVEASGARTRFYINAKSKPQPPSFQWVLRIVENRQDKRTIGL